MSPSSIPRTSKSAARSRARSVDVLEAAWNPLPDHPMWPSFPATRRSSISTHNSIIELPYAAYNEKMSSLTEMHRFSDDETQSPQDCWKTENHKVTLPDGTVVGRDRDSGKWFFPPQVGSRYSSYDALLNEKTASLREFAALGSGSPIRATNSPTSPKEEAPPQKPANQTGPNFSKTHEVFFIINVCLAQFLSLAALSQTVGPLLIIGNAFDVTDPGELSWFTAAFSLTVGTFILPSGRMGDMFGHRKMFIIGWAWFAFWSLITGFSFNGNMVMLAICRALQGMGPALLVPNAMALVGRTYPMGMKRNIIFSLFGAAGPTGFVVGAIFSSIFAQLAWWPWCFWMLGIICTVVTILTFFVIPPDKLAPYPNPTARPCEKFDLPGAITGVSGLVLINFAWNQAPIVGWSTPYIPVLLVLGIILMCAFVYIELRVASKPLIPIKGLQKEAVLALTCIAAGWGSHGIWLYYFYLFAEKLRGYTALSACAQLSPVALLGPFCALSVGFLMKKMPVSYVMSISMMAFLTGTVFLATAPKNQTYWANTFLSVIIMPAGMNLSFPAATILMSNALPREHQGIAASLVSTMVNYSISTGLGIAGTIDRYVSEKNGLLAGYRAAWYFGIALDVVGVMVSCYFIWQSRLAPPTKSPTRG